MMNPHNGSVERVLQDIDLLMKRQEELTNIIQHKERFSLCDGAGQSSSEPKTVSEAERVTIQYSVLHYIVSERNFLITNKLALEEAVAEERKQKGSTSKNRKKTFINSEKAKRKDLSHAPSRGLILGSDIETVTNSFQPLPRKNILESTKRAARKYDKDFDKPELVAQIPSIATEPLKGGNAVSSMKGPGHSSADYQLFGRHCCCHTISTYPTKEKNHLRDGDPICDRYFVKLYENRVVGALADGCNWGERSRRSAKKACKQFTLFMNNNHKNSKNIQELARLMLQGFADAHRKILESAGEGVWEAGTTTLNGHVILRVYPGDGMLKWAFLCCNLGDCKAFCYSKRTKKVRDITRNTRVDIRDSGDPGGRLGPRNDGKPDLRNLSLYWQYCEEDDYIFIVSDGVYDNCDIRHLGLTPNDMDIDEKSWDDVDANSFVHLNTEFVEQKLNDIINGLDDIHPQSICAAVTNHCAKVTENARKFMVENPNCRLPKDYSLYPGKVDHTTVLCYKVGEVTLSYDQWMGK